MLSLDEEFERVCSTPSDINEHCVMLRNLAAIHDNVVELGVRYGVSTIALLAGRPKKLFSVDLRCQIDACAFGHLAQPPTAFKFIVGDSLTYVMPPCDFLFIDTLHTRDQLYAELIRHTYHVSKTIAMHDTESFGAIGEDGKPGLTAALHQFLDENHNWKVSKHFANNNGLTIISRSNSY